MPESTSSVTDPDRSLADLQHPASISAPDHDTEKLHPSRSTSGSESLNSDNGQRDSIALSFGIHEEPLSLDEASQLRTQRPIGHRLSDTSTKEKYYEYGEERDRVIPKQVLCYLMIMFDGEKLCKKKCFHLDWQSDNSYRTINEAAQKCLQQSPQTIDKKVWRTDGVCKLFKKDQEYSSKALENEDENEERWYEVLHLIIAQFVAIPGNEYAKFHLEITWTYAAVNDPTAGARGAYRTKIADLLDGRMRTNWRKQKFIPQRDLHAIMSQSVIEHLINKDESLKGLEGSILEDGKVFNKKQFIHKVSLSEYKRLLALCVYEEIDLICLWQMLYRSDKPLKFPLTDSDCPSAAEKRRFDNLIIKQWYFEAYQFPKPTDAKNHCINLRDEDILPIEGCGEHKPIGWGSSKDVYKVRLQAGHHQFTADKTCVFALKEFRNGSPFEDFERESKVLRRLCNVPHKHITPHYASWSQAGHFFMLSPLAAGNLKEFWNTKQPQLDVANFILWELRQLQGLADGLRYIYNLGGCHFDLKGENVLVFDEAECRWPTLKIADFGSAKIQPRRSGPRDQSAPTNSYSQGTSAYEAPDYVIRGQVSRPYDVWTLGCIFMEMLVWTFGGLLFCDLQTFSDERRKIKGGKIGPDSMFWCVESDGTYFNTHWKPAVRERLQELKELCDSDKGKAVFRELVLTTSKMLRMDPVARPKPYEVHNDFERMTLWAEEAIKEEDWNVQDRLTGAILSTTKSETAGKSYDNRAPVRAPFAAPLMGSTIAYQEAPLAQIRRPALKPVPDGTDFSFMGLRENLHLNQSEPNTFQQTIDGVDHISGSQSQPLGNKADRPLYGSHLGSPYRDTFAEARTVVPSGVVSDDYPHPPSSNPAKRRADYLEVPRDLKRRSSIS